MTRMQDKSKHKIVRATLIVIMMLVVMLLLGSVLVGCSNAQENSEYIGIWKCTTASVDDTEIKVEDVIGDYSIDIESGGTVKTNYEGREQEGEWETVDGGIKITSGDTDLEFKDNDGKLVVENDGLEMVFEKEKSK